MRLTVLDGVSGTKELCTDLTNLKRKIKPQSFEALNPIRERQHNHRLECRDLMDIS